MQLGELIKAWHGESVVVRYDKETGTWIFIALHSSTLGTPVGGCRMRVYDRPEDGLRDAMRLAEGMTYKWASAGLAIGGGKSVLAIPRPLAGEERTGLLRRFGHLLASLNGSYRTGEDLGTTPEDMCVIAEETVYVAGVDPTRYHSTDPGPYTARGVFVSMEAALEHAEGDASLGGKTVLIQGVGDVGAPLARMLADAGAKPVLSDADVAKAEKLAAQLGAEVVETDAAYGTACDIFAPCAIGAVINTETIPTLQCRIVCGSANNQLGTVEDADRLQSRGILYAPDFVANAGGAIAFGLMMEAQADDETIATRIDGLRDTLREIFAEAASRNESPLHATRRRVDRAIAQKRPVRAGA